MDPLAYTDMPRHMRVRCGFSVGSDECSAHVDDRAGHSTTWRWAGAMAAVNHSSRRVAMRGMLGMVRGVVAVQA